jgi:Mor family transcriptional regulator
MMTSSSVVSKRPDAVHLVKRNMDICMDAQLHNASIQELAAKYGLSERQVYRVVETADALLDIIGNR